MIVTDKKYMIDNNYLKKLDLMIKRIQGTDDVVLPIDGDEGQGKTEFAVGTCYYVSYKTKRKYSPDNIFFDLDKVIKFASSTQDQIIHFDEAVLGLLATNWHNKLQQKFIKLVMIARKKRHFVVLCIPKFHRLPQYLIEERAIGLVHVYSRKNIEKGRFCYFTKKGKDLLYGDWRKSKIKNYNKYSSFNSSFVKAMEKVFSEEQVKQYDDKKDKAILEFGESGGVDRAKKWMNQRNIIIKILKETTGLSCSKLSQKFKGEGVELGKPMIAEICATQSSASL